jgi:hypothetical protein
MALKERGRKSSHLSYKKGHIVDILRSKCQPIRCIFEAHLHVKADHPVGIGAQLVVLDHQFYVVVQEVVGARVHFLHHPTHALEVLGALKEGEESSKERVREVFD